MMTRRMLLGSVPTALLVGGGASRARAMTLRQMTRAARDAYIYGFPLVENYGTLFTCVGKNAGPDHKAPCNRIWNASAPFTPDDTLLAFPTADTLYSFLWADMRADPVMIRLPQAEPGRYQSLQFVDLYTYNFAYAGGDGPDDDPGDYLLAGPGWSGSAPKGIKRAIIADTEIALVIYCVQLFGRADLPNARKIQAGFSFRQLGEFLGGPEGATSPLTWLPFSPEDIESLEFFDYLNLVLQFCPILPEDRTARARFAQVGIEPGKPFNSAPMSMNAREAMEMGVVEAMQVIADAASRQRSIAPLFGTRASLGNNYLDRAVAAKIDLYCNSGKEIYQFEVREDATGAALDGAGGRYVLRFPREGLPPAGAFWSVTMYDARTRRLVANPIGRYVIDSSMLRDLKPDPDGAIAIFIQTDSPGGGRASNWLPAPNGPACVMLRCYRPQPAILDGRWKPPAIERVG